MYNKISILITILFIINISGKAICDNGTKKYINKELNNDLFNQIKNDKIYPVVLLHGILSNEQQFSPVKKWLNENVPNTVYNLEIGNGKPNSILKTMDWQLEQLCNTIYNIPELKDGFHFIGMSQGGLLARAYVENCNAYPVINLITWVSPHGGVYGLGNIKINMERIYLPESQEKYSFAGYFKSPFKYETYLQNSTFLPKLNNELLYIDNEIYPNVFESEDYYDMIQNKENIMRLQNFVMIWSPNDDVLSPPQSGKFEFYKILDEEYYSYRGYNFVNDIDVKDLEVINFFESDQFKLNLLGLRTLWETGRLHILETNCTHAGHNSEECFEQLGDLTFPFLI